MKIIFKIARTELRNLFYSPVAWFLTIVFMVQCGVFYTNIVFDYSKLQYMAVKNIPVFKDFGTPLTSVIFLTGGGVFSNVLENLYLFVPLLTMGLISREINNGTIKLLYSSPVKLRQIVLGKYFAIMIYNLLLLAIVGFFMIMGVLNIKSADYGLLISAALGFYLLVCAYTAIGMFMSSLTTYQIVSAVGTFLIIFILTRISTLWQKYDLVRDLTYFLSIGGRTHKMLRGLITTKDLMYFVLIVYMFISFTLLKLKDGRESTPWYNKALRYLAVFASVLLIGYATSRPGYIGYLDTTAGQVNTIHGNTQQIIKQMGDEPVEVTLYTNLLGDGLERTLPKARNEYVWDFWDRYVRFKPKMNFRYVFYYDVRDGDSSIYKALPNKNLTQIAKEIADYQGIPFSRLIGPNEIRKMIDLNPEDYRAVMQVKYKGQGVFLRTFNDPTFWPDEEHVAAAFKQLVEGTAPKVYYVTGNLERSIHKKGEREYFGHTIAKEYRTALINHGHFFDTISLDHRNIPSDATTLVLADPKVKLSAATANKIREYLTRGGNMLFFGEPGKQQVINPVLQPLGVQLMNGTLVELTKDEMPQMVIPYITEEATNFADEPKLLFQKLMLQRRLDTLRIKHPGTAGIAYADSGFHIKHLLVTRSRDAWAKAGPLVTDSVPPVFDGQEGDFKRDSFSTVISLSRKIGNKEQRIVIAGDADFMSNLRNGGDFVGRSYYCWLENKRYPVYTPREAPKDVLLTIGPITGKVQQIVCIWILPGLVLLLGTILLIRRKRQ